MILSGSGSDGVRGVGSIQSAGGVVVVQEPRTALHQDMPRAALETELADLILPAELIGPALQSLTVRLGTAGENGPRAGKITLDGIVRLLSARTGIAFTAYKRATLHRRIKRRMAMHRCGQPDAYHALLLRSPDEVDQLFKDALVSVTSFFRDPGAFGALIGAVRRLAAERRPDEPLRIWVPGCATGEEAYSVAIAIAEVLGDGLQRRNVQIFATDVDETSLQRARRGVYPTAVLESVPPAYRERYFRHSANTAEVARSIRGLLRFARHDLLRDPPFSRLDLISCRNLLIYLGAPLQQRLMAIFHHMLRPGGVLFLGAPEEALDDGRFEPVDRVSRIYLRRPGAASGRPVVPAYRPATSVSRRCAAARPQSPPLRPEDALRRHLARIYAPSAVLINDRFEILQIHGDVRKFLALQQDNPGLDILSLAERPIRHELRAVIHRAVAERAPVRAGPVRFTSNGERRRVVISARPLDLDTGANATVVTFEVPPPSDAAAGGATANESSKLVEDQLNAVREAFEVTIEELEAANQELQSLNDELHAANEELQIANEELQTSNETLQSANEQLMTVNEEIRAKGELLRNALADVANVLKSVGLPMLVLSNDLTIQHYTKEANEIFALRPTDVGQRVAGVPRFCELPDLEELLTGVIASNQALTMSVPGADKVYVLRAVPYHTNGKPTGAILSFVDVTPLERAKRDLQRQSEWLGSVTNSVPALIGYVDWDMKLRFANKAFEDYYGRDIVGRSIDELIGARQQLEARPHVERTLREARTTWFELTVVTPDHGERALMIGLVPDRREGAVAGFFLLVVDITMRKQTERALAESEERYRQLVEHAPDAILTHAEGGITFANPATAALFGAESADQLIGLPISELIEPEFHSLFEARPINGQVRAATVRCEPVRCRRLDGEPVDVELASIPHLRDGRPGAQVILRNITERVRVEERMRHLAHHDALTDLPNRTYFQERLRDALALARRRHDRVALHLLDLDYFKEINDSQGHDIGDALLKEIARHLKNSVRATDTVARLGGDEFAVIQTGVDDAEDATVLAQKLIDAVDQRRSGFSQERPVGVTIGIALFPDDDDDPEQLLRKADIALYRAKDEGRHRYLFFIEQFNERTQDRRRLLAALPAALRRSEFETHYQPILRLESNEVVAVEALLRWRHPRRGRLDAERFVDIAKLSGQMRALDRMAAAPSLQPADRMAKGGAAADAGCDQPQPVPA